MSESGEHRATVVFVSLFDLTELYWALTGSLDRSAVRSRFITTDGYWRDWLIEQGCDPADILHLGVAPSECEDPAVQLSVLAEIADLELASNVGIHEAMMMDSFARRRDQSVVRAYVCMYWRAIVRFLDEQAATHVVCEPTNLTELIGFLACHKLGISFVVPRVARIPDGRVLFFGDPFEFEPLPVTGGDAGWDVATLLAENRRHVSVPAYASAPAATTILTARTLVRSVRNRLRRGRRWNKASLTYWPVSFRARVLTLRLIRSFWLRRRSYRAPGPYSGRAFYPLHVQPEASIDVEGSYHNDQLNLIKCFRQALPADYELVVKEHPNFLGQKGRAFFRTVERLPGVRLVRHDTHVERLLEDANLVFTVGGTVGFQAALRGIPVVMTLPMYFSKLSMIRVASDPLMLPAAVRMALVARPDDSHDAKVLEGLLERSHPGVWGHPVDTPGVMDRENLEALGRAMVLAVRQTHGPPKAAARTPREWEA